MSDPSRQPIFVVEDDRGWEEYYRELLSGLGEVEYFYDAVAAVARMDEILPRLVILDVLLTGPTGFALLNEMQSYPELAEVPVIVVSSVDLAGADLGKYGVVAVFDKTKMRPEELVAAVSRYTGSKE